MRACALCVFVMHGEAARGTGTTILREGEGDSTSVSAGARPRRRSVGTISDANDEADEATATEVAPSVATSEASASLMDAAQNDATTKFIEVTGHEEIEEEDDEEEDEETRNNFTGAYWAKVEEFDEDKDDDVMFFRGIRDPDAFTAFSPRGVVLVRNADQTWDALIRKVPNEGHQAVTFEFVGQLGNYAHAMNSEYTPNIRAGGGHSKVDEIELGDNEVLPEKRIDADVVLRVALGDDTGPRVVIEVELSNRGPLKLAKDVHQLMKSWQDLRCVIGIKIYKRSERGGSFAVVVIVWKKKRDDNSIYVERIFNIGPRASAMRSKADVATFWEKNGVNFDAVADDDGFEVAKLPHGLPYPPLPKKCPGNLLEHYRVRIDMADVYHRSRCS